VVRSGWPARLAQRFTATTPEKAQHERRAWAPSPDPDSYLDFVHEAPAPVFSRLEGLDDRVVATMEVLSRVLVWRGVATAHVAACQAQAQMYPGSADSQAILAALRARDNPTDRLQMRIDQLPLTLERRVARGNLDADAEVRMILLSSLTRPMARNFPRKEHTLPRSYRFIRRALRTGCLPSS
jgi:hypothetical protein